MILTHQIGQAHLSIYDVVLPAKEEYGFGWITRIWNLLIPQRVGGPVEVALQEIGNPELSTNEILDD